ncbi:phage tail tube protein [uncultured Actinomyces sp.]|uniref:phage tail tube protein n=1 Tax=uncultured Actinomyces sp. TaxID=249061 RepID=UPI0026186B75|nr:hypothetical protein [uncultured Actinomyces sp.]
MPESQGTPGAASTTTSATTEPTQYGFSYEYGVDIKISNEWLPIRFISSVNPTVSPKEVDAATYDDKGADHPVRVGETPSLSFYVQMHRLASGKFLPEVEALLAATRPDAVGSLGVVRVRYYDKPVNSLPNPNEAYELTATVSAERAATGNAELSGWNFTLNGQGPRVKIPNPAMPAVLPA